MKRALITIATVGFLAPTAWVAGGECSIWPSSFSSLWPFSSVCPFPNVCPFSKICPSSLPSLCPCPSTVWW